MAALRGVGHLAPRKLCELPPVALKQFGIKDRDLFSLQMSPQLNNFVEHVCSLIQKNLKHVEDSRSKDSALKLILLPTIQLKYTVKNLQNLNFDIFHEGAFSRSRYLPFHYKWKTFLMRIWTIRWLILACLTEQVLTYFEVIKVELFVELNLLQSLAKHKLYSQNLE